MNVDWRVTEKNKMSITFWNQRIAKKKIRWWKSSPCLPQMINGWPLNPIKACYLGLLSLSVLQNIPPSKTSTLRSHSFCHWENLNPPPPSCKPLLRPAKRATPLSADCNPAMNPALKRREKNFNPTSFGWQKPYSPFSISNFHPPPPKKKKKEKKRNDRSLRKMPTD